MRKLAPVSHDALTVYDSIVKRKRPKERRERLQKLRSRIRKAYTSYDLLKPNLEQIKPDKFKNNKEDLLRCYSSSKYFREQVYTKIRLLSDWCAYCSMYTTATLDHYLPKHSYSEFCVLPANLIPSCAGCNNPRDFKDEAGARALVHPYFDAIPLKDRLLVAVVTIQNGLPEATFSVDIAGGADPTFAELYARHFKLLSLDERYPLRASEELGEVKQVVRSWGSGLTHGDAKKLLGDWATATEQKWGVNDFRAALRRGAANSDEFLNFCLTSVA